MIDDRHHFAQVTRMGGALADTHSAEAMRDAAARVADRWADPSAKMVSALLGLDDAGHKIAARTAAGIAAAIRALPCT